MPEPVPSGDEISSGSEADDDWESASEDEEPQLGQICPATRKTREILTPFTNRAPSPSHLC